MSTVRCRDEGAVRRATPLVAVVTCLATVLLGACSESPAEGEDRHTTIFGSNVWRAPGESRREALARVDEAYGPIGIARIFSSGLPPTWGELRHDVGARPVVVSFRMPPEQVLSGAADDRLTAWFRAAPVGRSTFWAYFHEPEDDAERGDFSAEDFAAAWSHIERLAAAVDNPRLHATVILMCWTANERSGRDWRDYVPDSGAVDVLAWDCYAKGSDASSYADVTTLLEPAREASAEAGADWAIGELGARIGSEADGADRAAWLEAAGAYAAEHDARFVTYFDAPIGGEFRLTDEPSVLAWAELVRGSVRTPRSARHTEERTP